MGARVLCGLLCGLIYRGVCKLLPGKDKTCAFIGALSAPLLNTVLFMGALVAFFYDMPAVQEKVVELGAANPLIYVVLSVGVQGALEAVICCVVGTAVTVPLKRLLKQ